MTTKTEKMQFWIVAHSKWSYVGKVTKLIFWKIDLKNLSILKHFWLEKYLKVVFSTEIVWKIMIYEFEIIIKFKMGQIKNHVFAAFKKVCSGQMKLCLRHGFCRN